MRSMHFFELFIVPDESTGALDCVLIKELSTSGNFFLQLNEFSGAKGITISATLAVLSGKYLFFKLKAIVGCTLRSFRFY